jgi:hypothetical protein
MMKRCILLLALGLQLLSGGCALAPERLAERSEVEGLLANYRRLTSAAPDVQRKEFLEALSENERSPDDGTRLRLALTYVLPGVPWRDDSRVQQLLAAIETPSGDQVSPRRDLALLIEKMLQFRRDDLRKCEQRAEALREERRKLEQRLDASREDCKKAEVLQQKLDELRDIDRDLRKRRPARQTKP